METLNQDNFPINTKKTLQQIDGEIDRLSDTCNKISKEKYDRSSLIVLIIAIFVNVVIFWMNPQIFMVLWISASLYFYLFYPMLPLFLFPLHYIKDKKQPKVEKKKESMITWARNIHIFKNKRIGFRLFMRFFILSLLPLTVGMLCIYLLSVIFTAILYYSGIIPESTHYIILLQCLGIILFYIEIFFFRGKLLKFTHYVLRPERLQKNQLIFLGILGLILLAVGSIVVILLLIAILMPGFTLVSFINVSEFVKLKTNVWVLIILIGQVIFMQFLQSFLSLRIASNMCRDLIDRLSDAKSTLTSHSHREAKAGRIEMMDINLKAIRKSVSILKESELYAYNRRKMFGLFPSYSVGINIPTLFGIQNLVELEDVFPNNEYNQ